MRNALVWTCALAFAATACGGDDDDDDDVVVADAAAPAPDSSAGVPDASAGTPDADPAVPDASAGTPDVAVPDAPLPDASSDAAVADASTIDAGPEPDAFPPTTYNGIVMVGEASGGVIDLLESTVVAIFTMGDVLGTPSGTFGDCTLYDGGVADGRSAGTITITGANVPLTLVPSGSEPGVVYDTTVTPPANVIDPGDTLTVSATGGTIPSFSGTVVVPNEVLGYTTPGTANRIAPFATSWTADASDLVWVMVQTVDTVSAEAALLVCVTDDDGAYEIPQEAMALLPATHDLAISGLWRFNETPVFLGTAAVDISAGLVVFTDVLTYVP